MLLFKTLMNDTVENNLSRRAQKAMKTLKIIFITLLKQWLYVYLTGREDLTALTELAAGDTAQYLETSQ
jgi:hypothetical protein